MTSQRDRWRLTCTSRSCAVIERRYRCSKKAFISWSWSITSNWSYQRSSRLRHRRTPLCLVASLIWIFLFIANQGLSFTIPFYQNHWIDVTNFRQNRLQQNRGSTKRNTPPREMILLLSTAPESSSDRQLPLDVTRTSRNITSLSLSEPATKQTLLPTASFISTQDDQDQASSRQPFQTQIVLPFITPYQLLHSDCFPLPRTVEETQQLSFGGYDRTMSLNFVVNLMKQCLRRIVTIDDDSRKLEHILDLVSPSNDTQSEKIVRIEHQVYSTSIDPLAWLRRQYSNVDNKEALLYLCTHEKDTEAAVIGSAMVVNDTDVLWDRYFLKNGHVVVRPIHNGTVVHDLIHPRNPIAMNGVPLGLRIGSYLQLNYWSNVNRKRENRRTRMVIRRRHPLSRRWQYIWWQENKQITRGD
jgi:hypothetical protein